VSRLAHVPAYRVKVTLRDVKPPVWRRLVLPGFWHLGKVHAAVQASMGWSGGPLHEFSSGGQRWGQPDPGWDFGEGVLREERTRLHEVVHAAGDQLAYTYDFGDDWRHVLVVEELLAPQRSATCCQAKVPAHPTTAAARGAIRTSCRRLTTRRTQSTPSFSSGSGGPSTPKTSTSPPLTRP